MEWIIGFIIFVVAIAAKKNAESENREKKWQEKRVREAKERNAQKQRQDSCEHELDEGSVAYILAFDLCKCIKCGKEVSYERYKRPYRQPQPSSSTRKCNSNGHDWAFTHKGADKVYPRMWYKCRRCGETKVEDY
ncbi:MAG: hypothetical protein K9L60_13380 [Methylovulum sp.]|nr:hypothetical protein [Methylovulum sp.]